jgi:hypothetical protein
MPRPRLQRGSHCPYKQIWFRKLENLVNMVFLVEVNNKYRTNLNKLCIKNTTPHVGTLGQNFSSEVKPQTYLNSCPKISNMFDFVYADRIYVQVFHFTRDRFCEKDVCGLVCGLGHIYTQWSPPRFKAAEGAPHAHYFHILCLVVEDHLVLASPLSRSTIHDHAISLNISLFPSADGQARHSHG